nr:dihydrofolate reductase family protein [Pseudomonas sp. BIGb0427]
MRKLIVAAFTSLDGVIQAPGGPARRHQRRFWLRRLGRAICRPGLRRGHADAVLAAVRTAAGAAHLRHFAGYWPHQTDSADQFIADLFNRVPKHVATHHPETLDWHNSHALVGELAGAIRTLKQQDGDTLLTQGSGELVRQLLAAGLVDELRLLIHPIILGRGKRLFDDQAQAASFTLADSSSTPGGVLIARYVLDGEVRTGSFA